MTPPWAAELAAGADPELVGRVVRLAATAWVTPDRIRAAVRSVLDTRDPSPRAVIDALEGGAAAAHALATRTATDAAAAKLSAAGAVVHVAEEEGYPTRLASAWPELGAPLWIFLLGPPRLPEAPAVAVVGSRHPTLDGEHTARELGMLLARAGVTVVSGMARGIDQAGHLGAIAAGGRTTAVLGTGFGVDYPRRDGPVRDAIAAAGGLVSELLPGTQPTKRAFLWRNRIISGLADVTVVVEGRSGSGALHTARMAASQGREVLAVPGPVRAPTSQAPLELIRDGAQPMTRLSDVLEVLGIAAGSPSQGRNIAPPPSVGLTDAAAAVLPLLGAVPAAPAALAAAANQPLPVVLAATAELVRRGLAAATPRGLVRTPA